MAASVGSDSAASNAPLADSSVEDDEHHQHIKRILQPDVEGTLMRGKLLFREGGIEHGSGWVSKDRRTMVMFVHLGDLICGHKGLVHGGLISAIFDDCMGYLFFADAASKYTGFTASLKVDYRHIMPANRTIACQPPPPLIAVVVVVHLEKLIPASEFADLVGAKSTLYAQAEALFVIPKPSWTTAPVSYLFSTIRSTFGI
ncbi:hypothetical protein BASA83_013281 [Batrachochytrium salamandrivorans]|nr:hypothetical protein BASA83_013281 [Batrachochytrium salamandrivorans]